MLGTEIELFSDEVLRNEHVSPDLVAAVSGADVRPDGHAPLELDALLEEIIALRDEGDGERFDHDHRYRWVLRRLWIAVGNEALAYTTAIGRPVIAAEP